MRRPAAILDMMGSAVSLYFLVDYLVYLGRFLAEGVHLEGVSALSRFISENTSAFLGIAVLFPMIPLIAVVGSLIAGMLLLRRRRWAWAVVGSVTLLLVPVINIFTIGYLRPVDLLGLCVGVTAIVLTVRSRGDFTNVTKPAHSA